MEKLIKGCGVLIVALIVSAMASVARADEPAAQDPVIEKFTEVCYDHIRDVFCGDGQARTAAAPAAPDPKVAALESDLTAMKAQVAALTAPKPKRTAAQGPTLRSRIAAIEARIVELEGRKPSDPGESYTDHREEIDQIEDDLAALRKALAEEAGVRRKADDGHDANNDAQSRRMDELARLLLAMQHRLETLGAQARPIEFAVYAAPLLLTGADGTQISYLGIAPMLMIPIWYDTSLEFEAGLLIGDDKNPFGSFSRVGVGYRAGNRVHLVGGIGLLMAGIDNRLEAESASVLGTAGLRFGIGDVRFLNVGFDIMLGNELDVDGEQDVIMGARALVGIRLPD